MPIFLVQAAAAKAVTVAASNAQLALAAERAKAHLAARAAANPMYQSAVTERVRW